MLTHNRKCLLLSHQHNKSLNSNNLHNNNRVWSECVEERVIDRRPELFGSISISDYNRKRQVLFVPVKPTQQVFDEISFHPHELAGSTCEMRIGQARSTTSRAI
eukprot:766124-Hanusia_phi.AAC.3